MTNEKTRASKVFAARLKETRHARGLSQAELAQRMTEVGRPMSKAALLRIEKGERGLSLDEALALAAQLHGVFSQMLTPAGEEIIWLTDKQGVDGAGLRAWLLHGSEFIATAGDYQRGEREKALGKAALAYAQALVDADRGDDQAGRREALRGLIRIADTYQEELERLERVTA